MTRFKENVCISKIKKQEINHYKKLSILVACVFVNCFICGVVSSAATNKITNKKIKTRVVITRMNDKGISYVSSDKIKEGWTIPALPGYTLTDLFFTKNTPFDKRRHGVKQAANHNLSLKPGQIQFLRSDIYPSRPAYKSLKKKDRPKTFNDYSYHSTPTIDFITIVRGTIVMRVGNQKVTLKEGDTVVQRGTKHTLWNLTNKVATLTAVMVGVQSNHKLEEKSW